MSLTSSIKSSDYQGVTLPIAPTRGRLSISIPPDNPDYTRFQIPSSPEDPVKNLVSKYPQVKIPNPLLQSTQNSRSGSQNGSPLASRLKLSVKIKAAEVMNSVNSLTDQLTTFRTQSNASQGPSPSNALSDQTYQEEISTPLLSAAESENMDEDDECEDSLYDNGKSSNEIGFCCVTHE